MKSKFIIDPIYTETEENQELKLFFNLPEKANKNQLQAFKKGIKHKYLLEGIPNYYLSSIQSLSKKFLVLTFSLSK